MQRLSSRPSLSRPSSLIRAGRLWCMRLPPLFSRWRATVASHQRDFFKMVKHLIELIESMYTYYNSLLLCTYIFNLQNSILSNFLYIFLIYLQLYFRLEIHQIKYILSDHFFPPKSSFPLERSRVKSLPLINHQRKISPRGRITSIES